MSRPANPSSLADPGPGAPRWQAWYFAACGMACGAALGYLFAAFFQLPRLFYDPATGRAFVARFVPGELPTPYVGTWLWALAGGAALGLAAFAMAAMARRVRRRPARRETVLLAGLWALSLTAVVLAYFTYANWP